MRTNRPARGSPAGQGGLLSLLLVLLTISGCERLRQAADTGPLPPVGNTPGHLAPELTGTTADGGSFELRADGKQATVLVFYRGLHCGICRERLRELEAHRSAYREAGADVVAVSAEAQQEVTRTPAELGVSFPVVRVDSATLAEWGLLGGEQKLPLPGSFVLDRRGVIHYRHVGRNAADRASDIELLAALQEILTE